MFASTLRTVTPVRRRLLVAVSIVLFLASLFPAASGPLAPGLVLAAPASVTVVGSLQSEAGCPGDWDPGCATTHLTYDAADDVWQGTWSLPADSFEYKAALNDGWAENYGLHAAPGGANISLALGAATSVKFYYDDKSHWITDNKGSVIAVAPGSFQSELGCSGDWDPTCLQSWLQDVDGDGTYTFKTTVLPPGNYEAKAAIDESWSENYGQGGVPAGSNIPFTVPLGGGKVTFSYVASTHILTIGVEGAHAADNNVEWAGLRHDSRDLLYRTPGGAVPSGTPVTLRFRTFHADVTAVKVRTYSLNAGAQALIPMTLAASDISCYEAALAAERCDFWQAALPGTVPDNIWYRFIVTDGTRTDYYGDDTWALDGGVGATTDDAVDRSWALMFHVPGFQAPAWAKDAVIYQIFPDRFQNGRKDNDPKTGDVRYDDPVIKLGWGVKPEGYCRNYSDADVNCPWRFDTTPPSSSPTKEQPQGRDYYGGDLKGVDQQLGYLKLLGVTAIYFNPIFDAGSNHGYDTQDYTKIDPYFGTQKDWENLVKHAKDWGIRIILDGVFNHMSSDSPLFDRYHHYATVGACESLASPYRSWFTFHDVPAGTGTCVGTAGAASASYDGWFGFDSIPVLTKTLPAVQAYFLTAPDSIARRWLLSGASGWRLDVSGDSSFPNGYWESFRSVTKALKPDSLSISETWQKDSALLRMLRGDRLDTTMNYRLRDAIIGVLAPQSFDSKGFADSGYQIEPSQFANRILSIREDYPDAAYYSLMNLLDSHDTERLLWTLTPGTDTTADKEANAANLAAGKLRLRLASLIQFAMPGAPTIYYGDEVGMTGDDDPDDRRTYPSVLVGGKADLSLFLHYRVLTGLRDALPVLRNGDIRFLLADDAADTLAFARSNTNHAAVIAFNRSGSAQTLGIPVAGFLPDGTVLARRYGVGVGSFGSVTVSGGILSITLPAMSGLLLATGAVDLAPPAAPANLHVTSEGNEQVSVAWDAVSGAAGYDVWVSRLTGGGYEPASGSGVGTAFTLTGLKNGVNHYVIVRARDAAGNASKPSNEVVAMPHLAIGWADLQWPPTLDHTVSAVNRTGNAYGQVWIAGATSLPGATPGLSAQLGFGTVGSDPAGNPAWVWVDASFNMDSGNNDEFVASLLPEAVGAFDYLYRYSTTGGAGWLYADLDGPITGGALPSNPGKLTVNSSGDTTAPDVPTGLHVVSASPAGIELVWDAVAGDPSLYGYEVLRSGTSGGPYGTMALVTAATFTDTNVTEGATYYYVVRSVDLSFNRSGNSSQVTAIAELRTVTLIFTVTVPATTDATARSVYIAGFLDRLDGGLPQWNPGGVVLTRLDATHWTRTFTGKEGTQIEYKFALGDWDHVEKDNACGEIGDRQLTLSYGATGTQTVNDTVMNWRNVSPCGN